jgi:hypothetical protein
MSPGECVVVLCHATRSADGPEIRFHVTAMVCIPAFFLQ